jgi:hypothetical protein
VHRLVVLRRVPVARRVPVLRLDVLRERVPVERLLLVEPERDRLDEPLREREVRVPELVELLEAVERRVVRRRGPELERAARARSMPSSWDGCCSCVGSAAIGSG